MTGLDYGIIYESKNGEVVYNTSSYSEFSQTRKWIINTLGEHAIKEERVPENAIVTLNEA